MAPVTRRAAKAQGNSPNEGSTDSSSTPKAEMSLQKPIALRSRRNNEWGLDDAKAATPKSKKIEVRIREEGASIKSAIEVQIPSSAMKTPRSRSTQVPDSQETENASDDGTQSFEPLSASKQLEEEATQKLESQSRRREESEPESTPLPKSAKSTRGSSAKKARESATPQSQSQSQSQSIESEHESEATPRPKAAKSSHVVFGDDDDVDKFVAAAAEKERNVPEADTENKDEEGEQEDSDDEAPEAVSTAAAAKETLKSARAAIEAAEQYAATIKRKRQERDNLLKKQAEKRKRTKLSMPKNEEDSSEDSSDGEAEERTTVTSKRQRRIQKLPDMLPAEFLTDSSDDEDDDGTPLKKMVKRPQKITFETAMQVLDAEGKRPRDEVVGSTRYRVLAQQGDPRLAPKMDKNSRSAKEALFRRGRAPVTVNKKRGFFVKR
ncbi:hypothetical protein GGR55DRAFT_246762 [Xylaria sp. FL0064]|nr:hypothetical protein GGR55DRAFT_246762 [Xylaria sp. FL0064]